MIFNKKKKINLISNKQFDKYFLQLSNDCKKWLHDELIISKNVENIKLIKFFNFLSLLENDNKEKLFNTIFKSKENSNLFIRFINFYSYVIIKYPEEFIIKVKEKMLYSFTSFGTNVKQFHIKEWKQLFKKYNYLWLIILVQYFSNFEEEKIGLEELIKEMDKKKGV